jgi:hypothetical protein
LSNGFATCDDPARLQAICDRLGPGVIRVFAERWWARLPLPLTPTDRVAGYWWDISMRQVEVSRTIVSDAPRHGRAFFEALVTDNLHLGRPDSVEVIFARKVTKATPGTFTTRVITRGVDVTVNAYYKRSRIKQYLKNGRALRIEDALPQAVQVCDRWHLWYGLAAVVEKTVTAHANYWRATPAEVSPGSRPQRVLARHAAVHELLRSAAPPHPAQLTHTTDQTARSSTTGILYEPLS